MPRETFNKTQKVISLAAAALILIIDLYVINEDGISGFSWVIPIVAVVALLLIFFSGVPISMPPRTKRITKIASFIFAGSMLLLLLGKFAFVKKEEAPSPAFVPYSSSVNEYEKIIDSMYPPQKRN